MNFNFDGFYPTPKELIRKMWGKIDTRRIKSILEPSAGKGNIVDYIQERYAPYKISVIEKQPELQSILKYNRRCSLIDSDFLLYAGCDSFDLIIMNPPFKEGDKHLLKAIDILFSGQIVCLLNAETLKNPFSNTRKLLAQKLEDLNADIEYIQGAFEQAERKTSVEIAIVYIDQNIPYETLFDKCKDTAKKHEELDMKEEKHIASRNTIEYYVQDYIQTINTGLKVMKNYFDNFYRLKEYISFNLEDCYLDSEKNTIQLWNMYINDFIQKVRSRYWYRILELKEVKERMTKEKRKQFSDELQKQSEMDFTESNIRQFILNIISSYTDTLNSAVESLFDKMTKEHHWSPETKQNIHYFNGWKTNEAFFVNKKVILPEYGGYGYGFRNSYSDKWEVGYITKEELRDIDIVMNYFAGHGNYISIVEALETGFSKKPAETRNVKSTFFNISVYKKGTIHLTFLDESIRRRFNIQACKNKKWLPEDYGKKEYSKMTSEEKEIVKSFEGKEKYNKNINKIGYVKNKNIRLLGE